MAANEFQEAKKLVRRAWELKKQGDYEQAEEVLQAGLEKYPDNLYLKANLADILYRRHDLEGADKLADQILNRKPSYGRALLIKGNVALTRREPEQAREYLAQAYEADPSSYTAVRLAKALVELEEYEEAVELLQHWRQQEPDNSYLEKLLARVYEEQGKLERAAAVYSAYLEQEPADQFAFKEKVRLELADKDPTAAAAEVEELLQQEEHQDNPHLYSLLADYLSRQEEYAEALKYYRQALQLDANNAYLQKQIGFALYELEKYEAALPYLKKAMRQNPGDFYTRSVLVNIYKELEREEEAITFLKELIQDNPGYESHWGIIKKLARRIKTSDSGPEQ